MRRSMADAAFHFDDPEGRLTDPERLRRLAETGLVSLRHDCSLDRLTRLAAKVTGAEVALVSLVESSRQTFPSAHGLTAELEAARETPLSHSFCQYVVINDAPLVISDAREHPVLQHNRSVEDHGVIAYAGHPLHDPDGFVMGTLCLGEPKPRVWTEDELQILGDIAAAVETEIALRMQTREVERWREGTHTRESLPLSEQPQERQDPRVDLEADLRAALAGPVSDLVLHYQPIVDLTTGRVVGVEALVRWQHPVLGLLTPDHFIDLAETTGLIHTLGDWVLDRAVLDATALTHQGRELEVAVNLSVRQLDDQTPALVHRALVGSGLAPERLTLEVRESALAVDEETTVVTLRSLSELGAKVAVDDFGTGFTSLLHLRRHPITSLKIGRQFVEGVGDSPDDEAICASIIALASAIGATTIGLGIEEQHDRPPSSAPWGACAARDSCGPAPCRSTHCPRPSLPATTSSWPHGRGCHALQTRCRATSQTSSPRCTPKAHPRTPSRALSTAPSAATRRVCDGAPAPWPGHWLRTTAPRRIARSRDHGAHGPRRTAPAMVLTALGCRPGPLTQ